MEKPSAFSLGSARNLPRQRKILFLDNGAYNIKAMFLHLEEHLSHPSLGPSTFVCASPPIFLTLPHCVGASPYAGGGLVGAEVLRHLPHYHSLLLRRPCTRRGGFLLDGVLEAYVWEHVLQRFSIEDERTLEVWMTVPYGVPKPVARVLFALVTERFHFASITVVSSSLMALIASEGSDRAFQASTTPGEALQDCPTPTTSSSSRSGCGIVVDAGFSCTTVIPYLDYLPVTTSIVRLDVGGKLLTNRLKEHLSFTQVHLMEEEWVVNHIKEKCCFVAEHLPSLLRLYQQPDVVEFAELMKQKGERKKNLSLCKHPLYRFMEKGRNGVRCVPLLQLYYLPSVPYLQPLGKSADEMMMEAPYASRRLYRTVDQWEDSSRKKKNKTRRGGSGDDAEEESLVPSLPPFPKTNDGMPAVHDERCIVEGGNYSMEKNVLLADTKVDARHQSTASVVGSLDEGSDEKESVTSVPHAKLADTEGSRKHQMSSRDSPSARSKHKRKKIKREAASLHPSTNTKLNASKNAMRGNEQDHPIPFLPYLFLQQECATIPEIIFTPGSIGIPQCGVAEAVGVAIFSRGLLSTLPLLQSSSMWESSSFPPSLLSRVVLFGGTSNFPGFKERLEKDVQQRRRTTFSSLHRICGEDEEYTHDPRHDRKQRQGSDATMKQEDVWRISSPTYFSCIDHFSSTENNDRNGCVPHFLDKEDKPLFSCDAEDALLSSAFPLSAAELQPIKGAYFLFTDPRFSSQLQLIQEHSCLPLLTSTSPSNSGLSEAAGLPSTVDSSASPSPSVRGPSPSWMGNSSSHVNVSVEILMEKLEGLW